MTIFQELKRRGIIAQATHLDEIEKLLDKGPQHFYIGFDATADSLHVGHYMQLTVIKRLLQAGHKPILLLGTGTTLVGDPTGRTNMRQMLTKEEIDYNADQFLIQMARVVDVDKCIVARNGDWLLKLSYVDMLREIGIHFSVNKMLATDSYKTRLETGLSFIEFNYAIMQSYDFLHLFQEFDCRLQLGGNDQWANIISGVDLIRRVEQEEAYGMTFTLLTTKDGHKMGKTMGGAVWLDEEKTPPYEFFQYWRNVDDAEVINCLKLLTFVPIGEIEEMEQWEGAQLNKAKEILAFELTKDIHGEDQAIKAKNASLAVFHQGSISEDMPTTVLDDSLLEGGKVGVLTVLTESKLFPSNSEARRTIKQNGVNIALDGETFTPLTDPFMELTREQLQTGTVVLRRGKKVFHKVTL